MTITEIDHTDQLLEQVIELGTKNSKTLGFFPEGAFRDHARKKHIIVAVDDNKLLGYILFRITQSKRIVSITHLCVEKSSRNQGIAKLLMDAVKDKYQHILKGIALNCREDYKRASEFWKRYGFIADSSKRSRSKDENYLIKWWYDFGNNNLFSADYSDSTEVKALLDASVLIKLRDKPDKKNREVHFLKADWLVDETQFYFAPESLNEILRDQDRERSNQTRKFIKSSFERARFKPDQRDSIVEELKSYIPGKSDNDESDRKQLAECITSGLEYFITNDEGILDVSERIYKDYSVWVFRPSDFIRYIDQITNGTNYHSYRVAGSKHEYDTIGPAEVDKLVQKFQRNSKKEKKHILRNTLTRIAADVDDGIFKLVKNSSKKILGFYASRQIGNCLQVEVIRTIKDKISEVLFKQFVNDLIHVALEKNLEEIKIQDPHFSESETQILELLGFKKSGNSWVKVVLTGQKNIQQLIKHNNAEKLWAVSELSEKISQIDEKEATILQLQLEKKLWPLKITDVSVPIYIIPIKPYWASQLFDFYLSNSTLFGSDPKLSWNSENVYYRSLNPVSEQAPGRILWYVSSADSQYETRQRGVAACSYLEEVQIGPAKELYSRFKNYGIYDWNDIYDMVNKSAYKVIKALKFSRTEVFEDIVPFNKVTEILRKYERPKNTFASPVEISNTIFNEIYRLGKPTYFNE